MSEQKQETVAIGHMSDGTPIEVDATKLTEHLIKLNDERLKKYIDELKESYKKPEDKDGKSYVTERLGGNVKALLEQMHNVSKANITEQWSVTIPNYTSKEVAGHLRDYVWVNEILKGEPGDILNIPYVKDFDLTIASAVGDAVTEATSIISETTTTLKQASKYTQVAYHLIERYDQNLLDELNTVFARAAVRAEDYSLMKALHDASSDTQFAGKTNRSTYAGFDYTFILDGITALLNTGKNIRPGELVLWLHPKAYGYLMKNIVGTAALVNTARPDIIQRGIVEDFLGVKIVVGGVMPSKCRKGTGTGTAYPAYLFRAKRALALAPKREMLIETDRDIVNLKLKIACSHTYAVKALDFKEAYRIFTDTVA